MCDPVRRHARTLARHQVQAIYEVEPYLTSAEASLGADPILDTCAGPDANLPLAGAVTTAAWATAHPGTARAFQRAMARAAALADTSRAAAEQAVTRYFHVSRQIAAVIKLDDFPASADPVQIQRTADHMHTAGLLARPLTVSSLIFR